MYSSGGMETKYYPFNITSILRNDSFSPNRGHFRSANQHQATVPRSAAATMSLAERLAGRSFPLIIFTISKSF